jgi:hypothetical protein
MERRLNYDQKAYSSAIMEDCIKADLGYPDTKGFVETKACELTVRNQFEKAPFNVRFCVTNDGWEIGVVGAEMREEGYCIVYVSGLQVMSFGYNTFAVDEVEKWHYVNDCLIRYFFGFRYTAWFKRGDDLRSFSETIYCEGTEDDALKYCEALATKEGKKFLGLT